MRSITVGITGASGSIYAKRLIEYLSSRGHRVYLTITEAGRQVIEQELGWALAGDAGVVEKSLKEHMGLDSHNCLRYFEVGNIGAAIASGTFPVDSMVVIPCSMATVSSIAHGASSNLLERAADVMLKEGKRLVLVPRETPLNPIHLRNMLALSEMGVRVVPAMPAFYNHPQKIEDLVDFLVGKVLDQLDIEHDLFTCWNGL
ncbi:MAG: UbiX family flavin prenyltransferase [Firmicutes bacterium]|nr:UbiX family flavin prenyltransferase [Bacillota bacterium]